jgi:hypothetical protein
MSKAIAGEVSMSDCPKSGLMPLLRSPARAGPVTSSSPSDSTHTSLKVRLPMKPRAAGDNEDQKVTAALPGSPACACC